MDPQKICYFVMDIESAADGELVRDVRYPEEEMDGEQAVARYRAELMDKYESDFVPYTYQFPVSVVIAKVREDFRIEDIVALDEPEFRPHVITDLFWRGWLAYSKPTLVTFNGRTFDLPLLELAAFRYGISVPGWFDSDCRSYDQPRNRFNHVSHLDLQDVLTNYGATRFSGGLNLAAHLLGKPGKLGVQGFMVQQMYEQGRLGDINDYCRCDVLDTYFAFLRTSVLRGRLALEEEQQVVAEAKSWLEERSDESSAYADYLEHWGDWNNPWESAVTAEPAD